MNNIQIYYHADCLIKSNGVNHPERKERLDSIISSIKEIHNIEINFNDAPLIDLEFVYPIHPKDHIDNIFTKIPKNGLNSLENEPYADTFLCPNSKNAILRACGAGILAADNLIINSNKKHFCAVRPPGHHAETKRANGFCFFNNVAITAKYLQNKYELNKIAIIDFDVHHGNGTQDIFFNNEKVLYISTHQYPFYPGTGSEKEKGKFDNIFNIPLASGTTSNEYLNAYEHVLKKIKKFKPDFILFSAGFDAHKNDPLANFKLESKDFFEITKRTLDVYKEVNGKKTVSILEGGYELNALAESADQHVKALNEF